MNHIQQHLLQNSDLRHISDNCLIVITRKFRFNARSYCRSISCVACPHPFNSPLHVRAGLAHGEDNFFVCEPGVAFPLVLTPGYSHVVPLGLSFSLLRNAGGKVA
jgi:hypothetical protein